MQHLSPAGFHTYLGPAVWFSPFQETTFPMPGWPLFRSSEFILISQAPIWRSLSHLHLISMRLISMRLGFTWWKWSWKPETLQLAGRNDCTLCLKGAWIEVGTKSTKAPMLTLGIQQLVLLGESPETSGGTSRRGRSLRPWLFEGSNWSSSLSPVCHDKRRICWTLLLAWHTVLPHSRPRTQSPVTTEWTLLNDK